MTGITTNVDASGAFGAVAPSEPRTSSVIDDVQNTAIPQAKSLFNRASSGVESFIENNPDLAKWGAIGIALVAAPSLFKVASNLMSNPAGFAKDAGMLGAKIAGGLAVASLVGTFVSNGDFSFDGAKNAVSQTVDDIGNFLGMNDEADGPPQINKDGTGPASVVQEGGESPSMDKAGEDVAAAEQGIENDDPAGGSTQQPAVIRPNGLGL